MSQDEMISLWGYGKETVNNYLEQLEKIQLIYVYRHKKRRSNGTYYWEMERPGLLASIPLHRLALESDGHPETLPELYRRAAQELGMTVNNLVDLVQSNMENLIRP